PCGRPLPAVDEAHHPVRKKNHDDREQHTEGEPPIFRVGHQLVLEEYEQDRTQHRTEEIRVTAEPTHEYEIAGLHPVSEARICRPDRNSDDHASEGPVDTGKH